MMPNLGPGLLWHPLQYLGLPAAAREITHNTQAAGKEYIGWGVLRGKETAGADKVNLASTMSC